MIQLNILYPYHIYLFQEEEVSEIKFFTKEEVLERINNNYDGLTDKTGPWNFLLKIL